MEKLIIALLCVSTCPFSAASLKARMPLLANNLRSNLYAELDVSDVNKQLKEYIDSNVENEVNDTCQAKIEQLVNNKISELKVELLNDFSNKMNQTKARYGYELYSVVQHVKSELTRLSNNSKKEIDELKQNFIKEKAEWRENFVRETKELRTELDEIKKQIAVTSCVLNGENASSGTLIKFDNVVTQIGFDGISQFKTTGKFTCEKAGLYLISVHIMSYTSGAQYNIVKNSDILSTVYIGDHPSYFWSYTGTGTVTVQLLSGDQVWVQAAHTFYVYNHRLSCISIVKIK